MTGSSFLDRLADRRAPPDQRDFLDSHRAAAACRREIERLSADVVEGAVASQFTDAAPVVRLSPDRCIVQLGAVALTLVWLRGVGDSVARGELFVILWRGAVATRVPRTPERIEAPRAPLATVLWERVLIPVAEDEATWSWRAHGPDSARCSSSELAVRCTDRLREAFHGVRAPRAI